MTYVTLQDKINEIEIINRDVKQIIDNDGLEWSEKYNMIFSSNISLRVFELINLDYYNPDTSYEEDIMAFAYALNEWVNRVVII